MIYQTERRTEYKGVVNQETQHHLYAVLSNVISKGQIGVDQIRIEVAHSLGISTGGTALKTFKMEVSSNSKLKDYGLIESHSEINGRL